MTALHFAQPGYDPVNQLMSELALGRHGWAMLPAFALIAVSIACLAFGIASGRDARWMRIVLAAAALAFLGAGVFPLGSASDVHIFFIAAAFVLIGLAMYLLPSLLPGQFGGSAKAVSWCLAAGLAVSVFLGHSTLPMGIGQRLAGVCVVAWICFVGVRLRFS